MFGNDSTIVHWICLGVDRDRQPVAARTPPTQLNRTAVASPRDAALHATALDNSVRVRIHDDDASESGIPTYLSKSVCCAAPPCRRRISDEKLRFDAGTRLQMATLPPFGDVFCAVRRRPGDAGLVVR